MLISAWLLTRVTIGSTAPVKSGASERLSSLSHGRDARKKKLKSLPGSWLDRPPDLPAASNQTAISSASGVVSTAMSKVKNPLLLPNEVGKGRPPVADLPPESFSYGKRTTSDGLSTGQALGEWAVFKPNMKDLPGRDYMALNRMAIKHGSGQCSVSAFHPQSC